MAKRVQTRRPTATPVYQTIPVTDMTAGLDLRRSPTLVQPARSVVCRNFKLAEPGALRVRPGYTSFSSNLSSRSAQGAQRIYLGSTQGTVIASDGNLYLLPDSGNWNTSPVFSGFSTVNDVHFIFDRDLAAAFDGATRAQKSTDLVNWTRFGIDAGTVRSTLALVANSSESLSTSQFGIIYTYKDRGLSFESDPIAEASTITLASTGQAIRVNVPNSSDVGQVDAIVVYARNITAGETVYRKATSGAMSGGASSTFVIESSAWSANAEAPSTHGVPPVLSYGVSWKNRWWARSSEFPTRLYFSEIFQPQGWPALFYIDLPFVNGEEINAIQPQGDTLLVMGNTQIFLIIGQTSLDFEVRPSLGAQSGAIGPKAVTLVEAGVCHASAEGVFIFDGATDRLLSNDLTPGWRDMVDNSASTAVRKITTVYDWREKELRVSVPRLYPRETRGEWILDLNRSREQDEPAWADTDRNVQHYVFWDGDEPIAGNRGRLQTLPSTAVRVMDENDGTTADGGDMTAEYWGPTFAAGLNRARFTDLHVEYEPHDGAFTAETLVDGMSQGQIALPIGTGLARYGAAAYGSAFYGGFGRRKAYTPLPLSSDGRNPQQKFVYVGQEDFAVYSYAIGMVPEPAVRQMSE